MDKSVVVAGAMRTTVGRRNGGWSAVHPARLLGAAQRAVLDQTGVDPALISQVIGGTVTQVGEQSFNLARTESMTRIPIGANFGKQLGLGGRYPRPTSGITNS